MFIGSKIIRKLQIEKLYMYYITKELFMLHYWFFILLLNVQVLVSTEALKYLMK